MRVMTNMHTKNNKKILKRIIGIIAAVTILAAAVVAIILFNLMRKPQVKLVEAMSNTIKTSENSGMNQKYGTYTMGSSMLNGNQNFLFEDSVDDDVKISLNRDVDNRKFLLETGINDQSFKLFANQRSSYIYIGDMAIRIQYAENLITNMSNSQVISILGIDNETVYAFGKAYAECMNFVTGNYMDQKNEKTRSGIIAKTAKYFLKMDSRHEGEETIDVGDRQQKCDIYSLDFDVSDFNSYLDDCFGTHDMNLDEVYKSLDDYMPEIEAIDNTADLVHDIKQFVNEIMNGANMRIYFAINNDGELVKLYADDISDQKVDVSLDFFGSDYIAERYRLSISDADGKSFVIEKKDINEDNTVGTSYKVMIDTGGVLRDMEAGLDIVFTDDTANLDIEIGDMSIRKTADVSSYEKGKCMDLEWNGDSTGRIHVGCDTIDIEKPYYRDSIDLFDTDIISAYKFIKEISNE